MAVDPNMYVIKPFFEARSFDELVKPLTMAAQAYKEQEAKLEDMTDKAAALEWIANQDPNSQTAALYRDMSDKIQGIRDNIMMNGFTGSLRTNILNTRKIYSANASEITRRYEDMKKYQERMEQLYDKDNSIVFSPESQNITIDDFAGGKRPKIKAISGNEIMARGAAVGKRLTSQIFGDGVLGQEMGGQFWKVYQSQGMDDTALWNALQAVGQANESKFNMAKQVIDGVYNSFKDFTPGDQQRLKDRFIEGVYSGSVYNRQVSYQQNGEYMTKAQRLDDARQNAQLDLQGLSAGYRRVNGKWVPDPDAIAWSAAMSGAKKGNGSGGGSGSGSGRVPAKGPSYMTGDRLYWTSARIVDQAPVDKNGNSIEEADDVDVEFSTDGRSIEIRSRDGSLIASYDWKNKKLRNTDAIKKDHGYHGQKLLERLGQEALDIVNNEGADGLYNYSWKYRPDKAKFRGDTNGLIARIPKERAYPTIMNGQGTTSDYDSELEYVP